MPTRKELNAKIMRIAMSILADTPDGVHRKDLWDQVLRAYPGLEGDWETYVNDKKGPLNNFHWRSTELVGIGWIFKDGNGTWKLTGVGRRALDTYPDPEHWWAAFLKRYGGWSRIQPQLDRAKKLLGALPDGAWVTADDLARETRLDASLLVHHLCGARPEGWHRLLDDNGTPPKEAHLTREETALVERLLEADGITGPGDRAPAHQRFTKTDLVQYLAEVDTESDVGTEDETKRRAWLVRGSNIQGENLVHALWLPQGICSLAASRLRDLRAGASRDEVNTAIAEDYAYLSAAERSRTALEYHAFLSRMRPDDIVLTNDGASVYIGIVEGPASFTASSGNRANLQRAVSWRNAEAPLDYVDDLPDETSNRLANPDATVIDLTESVGDLEKLLGEEPEQPVTERAFALPDADEALAKRLHFDRDWLQDCVELLRDRPQLIFYGPPGTGKTYAAQALAEHLTGNKPENVQLVQFHPAYSYEDFFEGYRPRPAADGQGAAFELTPGPLRKLADAARKHPDEPFVLIIDEINRGNLAKIFGELYFLLEYRGKSVNLLYGSDGGLGFTLPRNIVLLATMNTADRSIALIDAAMRRRFWFQELHPGTAPVSEVLARWLAAQELPDDAARLLNELNGRIDDRDFWIGPSYLMREAVHAHPRGLERVWRHQILPLLQEHHYGEGVDVDEVYGLEALRNHLGLSAGTDPRS